MLQQKMKPRHLTMIAVGESLWNLPTSKAFLQSPQVDPLALVSLLVLDPRSVGVVPLVSSSPGFSLVSC
jgi:hypothetical protein